MFQSEHNIVIRYILHIHNNIIFERFMSNII